MHELPKQAKLLFAVISIMVLFLLYGIVQEKLMTTPYGKDKAKFKDTALLVTINRLVSILFALVLLRIQQEPLSPAAPLRLYCYVSISNFLATFCQYEALKYVTFPMQTLGKCGKMIPVLLIGSLFYKKSYPLKQYLMALLVTLGCTIFLTTGEIGYHKKSAAYDTPFGLMLLILYLALDGSTSTTQERLFRNYKMSTYNQMLYVNLNSAFLGILALLLPNPFATTNAGDHESRLWQALVFAYEHPDVLRDSLVLSLCSSFGQLAIYFTIKEFGALVYSTVMTTRQFVAILLSALIFGHDLSNTQWIGALLVFVALYWKTFGKADPPQQKRRISPVLTDDDTSDVKDGHRPVTSKRETSPLLPVHDEVARLRLF